MRYISESGLLLVLVLIFCSCTSKDVSPKVKAAYYWSTTLKMDSVKTTFIHCHGITRLYVRYFDVVDTPSGPMPNATLLFNDTLPQNLDIIPTVFITNDCMKLQHDGLAEKIAQRVLQMNETNDVMNVREIQIDCDWTMSTRANFFRLLHDMRAYLKERGVGLSATIRLHQLTQPPPPVDRGVLMLYNTGDFTDIECEKPILDIQDVEPYLAGLAKYDLPLASAFPLYRWRLLFLQNHFVDIIHSEDEYTEMQGDTIVVREPMLDDILNVKEAVKKRRPELTREVILYELNEYNLTRFKDEDYEKILAD